MSIPCSEWGMTKVPLTRQVEAWYELSGKESAMDVYELDRQSPRELRAILGWSSQASDDVVDVVLALCLHVDQLQREVKALKAQLKPVDPR